MGAFSNYLENALLNHTLAGVPFPSPPGLYLALFTASLGEGSGVVGGDPGAAEVVGGAYVRQPIYFAPVVPPASQSANTNNISFLQMPACTVQAVALMDAAAAGLMLYYSNITPVGVAAGGTLAMAAGAFAVSLD